MPRSARPDLTPSQRRDELRILLRAGWQPLSAIMERLGVSRATAFRCLKELGTTDPLESMDLDGRRNAWRLPPSAKDHPLHITTSEMVALAFVKNALGFTAGTGIKEDLDALFGRLSHALRASDYAHWKNLDRKLFDLNEASFDYGDKMEVVNDVITALLREERITLTQEGKAPVKVDPYSLALYKKGLYVVGLSHARDDLRNFGLDKIVEVERHAGEHFAYPEDWAPGTFFRGPWGIIRGERVEVVLRFHEKVRHFVTRRAWHWTQAFAETGDGGVEMRVQPEGVEEMVSWVLGFGASAEVVEPAWLRERVAGELRTAAARYV
jgi:predicted DNA-binding transcriptional regulator YafY